MQLRSYLLICFAVTAFAQEPANSTKQDALAALRVSPELGTLTKFDLEFKGGPPKALVDAVSAAIGKPLNVIIPSEYQDQRLPSFKVKQVNVSELFAALSKSSHTLVNNYNNLSDFSYEFVSEGKRGEDSIWYFKVNQGPIIGPPRFCRFYLLTPYLDMGLTVDDITTAIQTGWKMLGNPAAPQMSFHKETQLLIATGDGQQIQLIDEVLAVLKQSKTKRAGADSTAKNEKT